MGALHDYGAGALPRPGAGLADLHVILAVAVIGDDAAIDARSRQIETLAREGRYLWGANSLTARAGILVPNCAAAPT